MIINIFENGPFMVNTYVVVNEDNGKGFILDPGSDLSSMHDKIQRDSIDIEAIICTHAHIDHIAGAKEAQDKYSVPLYLNELEREWVEAVPVQAKMFGVSDPGIPAVDRDLPAKGNITVAGIAFDLLHTPGHSPGSVSLYSPGVVFCGDALFNMSIGRTDLPGGSYGILINAIREKLFTLPDDTRVLCGHGPETTIGMEKKMNPFF